MGEERRSETAECLVRRHMKEKGRKGGRQGGVPLHHTLADRDVKVVADLLGEHGVGGAREDD